MIHLHRSNRAERLVDALAERVAKDPPAPTEKIVVVVPSRGMERWLSRELAERHGVWANPSFPFPRHFLESTLDALLGPRPDDALPFEPSFLGWALAALLDELADRPGFEEVAAYVRRPDHAERVVDLGFALADRFDQYAVYRPERVLGWEAGREEHFQATLFRELVARHRPVHLARRASDALDRLARDGAFEGLPSRVHVFGIATLPPLYIRLFAALAAHVEIRFYLLDPSQEHWAHATAPATAARWRLEAAERGVDPSLLHLDEGHPLLGSLGTLGRDFRILLDEACEGFASDDARFDDPGTASLLATLQSDVLRLETRREPTAPRSDEPSVEIHACHTKMREIEVLYDRILAAFADDASLRVEDVVVMAPDIDAYAPLIDAVFGIAPADRPRLTYTIADRPIASTSTLVDAFLRLTDLVESRFEASRVVETIAAEPIRRRFGLDPKDFETLRRFLKDAGIRWGADELHRRDEGLPEERANSWAFGLDRLLLGVATSAETPFGGVLPQIDVEGTAAAPLGGLARFIRMLSERRAAFLQAHPLAWWRDTFGELLETCFDQGPRLAHEHALLAAALDDLVGSAERAGFRSSVGLSTVRKALVDTLERGAPSHGFLSGGVTFCRLVPMRSIPFRVVALLGMDDESFPRRGRTLDFDLLAGDPRRGDRSVRDEDRYLFLEALLSARDRLIVTYVGRGVHDDRVRPRSVALDQLLDVCRATVSTAEDLVVAQPLQPFDPRAFDASARPRQRSFAKAYVPSAAAIRAMSEEMPKGLAGDLFVDPLPEPEVESVRLDELARCLRDPIQFFAERRLGLAMRRKDVVLEDREPIDPDELEKWQIGDELLRSRLEGETDDLVRARLRARGTLPFGTLGDRAFLQQVDLAGPLVEALAYGSDDRARTQRIAIDLGGTHVTGSLADVRGAGIVRGTFSRAGATLLAAWLDHLALSVDRPGARTSLFTRDDDEPEEWVFQPVEEAAAKLADLVALHRIALSRPLPLVRAAMEAVVVAPKAMRLDERLERGWKAILEAQKPRTRGSVVLDPYLPLFYPDESALVAVPSPFDFRSIARRVLGPLVESLELRR